ncbi:folylpolyglutamate synthase, mitochondrial-like [Oratosquilla oratoria]|uniref:folylpolyglutamate synthase, mitochondrial-like n=1 Tax=Oratosquilla oratoria TaxID=337810 RepID=UPI003F7655CD
MGFHGISHLTYCRWRSLRTCLNLRMAHLNIQGSSRMFSNISNVDSMYEEAVKTLNSLQTNAALLEKIRKGGVRTGPYNVPKTAEYLNRVGVSPEDVDKLSVIHIAGTKGKGSTCAFVESILREHGHKTGFYSSPHLVAVRERIRINGQPISKEEFTHYFWDVYNGLCSTKTENNDMPAYFKFLTVMAFKVFLHEEVDVAIVEVGIGGEQDCTNVIRHPVAVGITSLGIDHTSILGNTLEQIAWHKAGIMKTGAPAFTLPQPFGAAAVLQERAREKGVNLYGVPPLESYRWGLEPLQLGLAGDVQYMNASLALQLSQFWLASNSKGHPATVNYEDKVMLDGAMHKIAAPFRLSEEDLFGLKSVVWPGRSQLIERAPFTYFIDGAHTTESIDACITWYKKSSVLKAQGHSSVYKILIFNSTGDRDPEGLLTALSCCEFDVAIFTTNLVSTEVKAGSDQTNFTVSHDQQHIRCERQRNIWIKLVRQQKQQKANESQGVDEALDSDEEACARGSECSQTSTVVDPISSTLPADDVPSITFPCINDALVWLSCGRNAELSNSLQTPPAFPPPQSLQEASQVQVLVTGSLHLVGGVLAVLDPSLSCATHHLTTRSSKPTVQDLVKKKHIGISSPGTP